MISDQRIIFSDNGTLTEYTTELSNFKSDSVSLPIVAAEDALYIGGDMPFNHRYIEIDTANDQASVMSMQVYWSDAFENVIYKKDMTSSSGVSLAQSGIIFFTPDREEGWDLEDDTEDITELSSIRIYDMYWLKITFNNDLNAGTKIKYIGHKFSSDTDLYIYYPDLNNSDLQSAYESGKTDWKDQSFLAAEEIINDLRKQRIAFSKNQILNWEMFNKASIHKTAEIIFQAFGDEYIDNKKRAAVEYQDEMNARFFEIDRNANAILDRKERYIDIQFMRR